MIRVYVVVEGQTEESFVKNVLAPSLWSSNIHLIPILIGKPGHKGGSVKYARAKRDVLMLLKQENDTFCTTMFDIYGLGDGFPGYPPPAQLPNVEKVRTIEQAFKADICSQNAGHRSDLRFIPHLQLHEYESLLFSDPAAFARGINRSYLSKTFEDIRGEFQTPDDINDSPETAPSKRILAAYSSYNNVIDGTQAASAVGLVAMREQCPHFNGWVSELEELGAEA